MAMTGLMTTEQSEAAWVHVSPVPDELAHEQATDDKDRGPLATRKVSHLCPVAARNFRSRPFAGAQGPRPLSDLDTNEP